MAKLHFLYGAMNCGKSDTMISTAFNYAENGLKVVTMMPEMSMRKPGFTTSRAGKEWPIDIATHKAGDKLPDETKFEDSTPVYETLHKLIGDRAVQCVLVDEGAFTRLGAPVSETTYTDGKVQSGQSYTYQVQSLSVFKQGLVEGGLSDTASATSQGREALRRPEPPQTHRRSEERRVGKECRSRWSPYH